jgi:hypothetical protein
VAVPVGVTVGVKVSVGDTVIVGVLVIVAVFVIVEVKETVGVYVLVEVTVNVGGGIVNVSVGNAAWVCAMAVLIAFAEGAHAIKTRTLTEITIHLAFMMSSYYVSKTNQIFPLKKLYS